MCKCGSSENKWTEWARVQGTLSRANQTWTGSEEEEHSVGRRLSTGWMEAAHTPGLCQAQVTCMDRQALSLYLLHSLSRQEGLFKYRASLEGPASLGASYRQPYLCHFSGSLLGSLLPGPLSLCPTGKAKRNVQHSHLHHCLVHLPSYSPEASFPPASLWTQHHPMNGLELWEGLENLLVLYFPPYKDSEVEPQEDQTMLANKAEREFQGENIKNYFNKFSFRDFCWRL